jgi:2',3'-cyclic-nucleotide 2'-phosphodiesterase (5'-nucleotidase family)
LGHAVPILIANTGGMRKSAIAAGDIKAKDVFELLPFENELIEMDVTGEQLLKLLQVVLTERDAQSGAKISYATQPDKKLRFLGATLVDSAGKETAIDPNMTYRIVTIDYLYKLASGSYSILQEGKNVKPVGTTMRDAVMEYVQTESAAGRSIKPTTEQRFIEEGKPQSKGASQP